MPRNLVSSRFNRWDNHEGVNHVRGVVAAEVVSNHASSSPLSYPLLDRRPRRRRRRCHHRRRPRMIIISFTGPGRYSTLLFGSEVSDDFFSFLFFPSFA